MAAITGNHKKFIKKGDMRNFDPVLSALNKFYSLSEKFDN